MHVFTSHRGFRSLVLTLSLGLGVSAASEKGAETHREISDRIAKDLRSDRRLVGTCVETSVVDGIAIITGVALSLEQVERVIARTLAVQGVRAVVNRVRIVTAVTGDDLLRNRVMARLESHPAIEAAGIRAEVSDGNLELSGTVGSWDEEKMVREVAAGVPGIRRIENRLEVTFEGIRSDEAIRWQILHQLRRDPFFDGLPIHVAVSSGVVQLSGETGTSAERERLLRESSVTGVVEIRAEDLVVNPDLKIEAVGGLSPSDPEMLRAFRDALLVDLRVANVHFIESRCRDGMIFLGGKVASREEKHLVLSVAHATAGVIAVVDRLKVTQGRSDGEGEHMAPIPLALGENRADNRSR